MKELLNTCCMGIKFNNEKCRGLWGQMFLQNAAKIFLVSSPDPTLLENGVWGQDYFNSGYGEFQIMRTEQHDLFSSGLIVVRLVFTQLVFLLFNAFELPVILTHSLIEVCVLDSLIVWKPQSLSSEILLHHGSLWHFKRSLVRNLCCFCSLLSFSQFSACHNGLDLLAKMAKKHQHSLHGVELPCS